jgi:hypothetical protein
MRARNWVIAQGSRIIIEMKGALMFISSTCDMRPIQLDQIEGVEDHAGIMLALSDTTERLMPRSHATASPSDNARPRPEPRQVLHDQ